MPRRIQEPLKAQDELSFPVPYREQAKYLDLANRFMAVPNSGNGHNVIPIDGHHFQRRKKWKRAS